MPTFIILLNFEQRVVAENTNTYRKDTKGTDVKVIEKTCFFCFTKKKERKKKQIKRAVSVTAIRTVTYVLCQTDNSLEMFDLFAGPKFSAWKHKHAPDAKATRTRAANNINERFTLCAVTEE